MKLNNNKLEFSEVLKDWGEESKLKHFPREASYFLEQQNYQLNTKHIKLYKPCIACMKTDGSLERNNMLTVDASPRME